MDSTDPDVRRWQRQCAAVVFIFWLPFAIIAVYILVMAMPAVLSFFGLLLAAPFALLALYVPLEVAAGAIILPIALYSLYYGIRERMRK